MDTVQLFSEYQMKLVIFTALISFTEGVFFHDWYRGRTKRAKTLRRHVQSFERLLSEVEHV